MEIRPFRIAIPDAAVEDLKRRLANARWPDEVNDADWGYGASLAYMRELVAYWRDRYDWRAEEARLNAVPHFLAPVDGQEIHFIHVRGKGPRPMPILISHGWPGSFYELFEMIPMLADPAAHGGDPSASFDVIVPSMPGYGFSSRPTEPGMHPRRIAELYASLMQGLGYARYGVQGGDWGATVSTWIARDHPERVPAIHLNWVPGSLQPDLTDRPTSDAERAFLAKMTANMQTITSHVGIHMAKPQTLAYALNDSPIGLAAWLIDKFRLISHCDGDLESAFTRDALLTNASIYWFTQTIGSSIRLYREAAVAPLKFARGERIAPPLGYALFPGEVALPPREWLERVYDVRRWSLMERGGHFGAMEAPAALAADIRAYFKTYREGFH